MEKGKSNIITLIAIWELDDEMLYNCADVAATRFPRKTHDFEKLRVRLHKRISYFKQQPDKKGRWPSWYGKTWKSLIQERDRERIMAYYQNDDAPACQEAAYVESDVPQEAPKESKIIRTLPFRFPFPAFVLSFLLMIFAYGHSYQTIDSTILDGIRKANYEGMSGRAAVASFVHRNIFRDWRKHDFDTVMIAVHSLMWGKKSQDRELAEQVLLELKSHCQGVDLGSVFYNLGELEKIKAIENDNCYDLAIGYFVKAKELFGEQWLKRHKAETAIARLQLFKGDVEHFSLTLEAAEHSYKMSNNQSKADFIGIWAVLKLLESVYFENAMGVEKSLSLLNPKTMDYETNMALGLAFLGDLKKSSELCADASFFLAKEGEFEFWLRNALVEMYIEAKMGHDISMKIATFKRHAVGNPINPFLLDLITTKIE